MVKVKDDHYLLDNGMINMDAWLTHLQPRYQPADLELIRNAAMLAELAGADTATESGESCIQQGLAVADILADLELDHFTLAAAIVSESVQYSDLSIDDIREQLGDTVANLVIGVERMGAINNLSSRNLYTRMQMENIRKMLIAMVDDMRVVLIKLAEHLQLLRHCAHMPENFRQQVAQETMNIYAPLANRLGIGQLKWEMEDQAFRFLEPKRYKEIASALNTRRVEREQFVRDIVHFIRQEIENIHIAHAKVYGRAKHIHSIYKKMTRKNVNINEIYDAIAVRILVDTVEQCYQVLSIVHNEWEQVPQEFDDYIANPKTNGYKSLHTAVKTPEGRVFEVQIRTYQMHSDAERGVAAHWLYKEGGNGRKAGVDAKIEWLLEVLSWQKEVVHQENITRDIDSGFFEDRVYIFTPTGDIVDLPKGSTPLDFAYHVHSQVGHRCRGAKIDGKIVPLTHVLQTGEQVEIITGSEPKPSRDWLNPHRAYLKSPRAKAKVLHWFKQLDYDKNKNDGKEILERELKRLHLHTFNADDIANALSFKCGDDLFAALGRGDVRLAQIINRILPEEKAREKEQSSELNHTASPPKTQTSSINVSGVSHLLTYMAGCCHPLPGDNIIGYITIGRGISIHRENCPNVLHANEAQKQRLIDVTWTDATPNHYPVGVRLHVQDTPNIQKEIQNCVSQENARVLSFHISQSAQQGELIIESILQIENLDILSRVLNKLEALPNVIHAERSKV